jgi:hypothetical protein
MNGPALVRGQGVDQPAGALPQTDGLGYDAVCLAEGEALFDEGVDEICGEDGRVHGRGHALRHRADVLKDEPPGLQGPKGILDAAAERFLVLLEILVVTGNPRMAKRRL